MSRWKDSKLLAALISFPLCVLGLHWGICAITGSELWGDMITSYYHFDLNLNFAEYAFLGGVLPGLMIAFAISSVCLLGLFISPKVYEVLAIIATVAAGIAALAYIISAAIEDAETTPIVALILLGLLFVVVGIFIVAAFLLPTLAPIIAFEDHTDNGVFFNMLIALGMQIIGHIILALAILLIRAIGFGWKHLMAGEFGPILVAIAILVVLGFLFYEREEIADAVIVIFKKD